MTKVKRVPHGPSSRRHKANPYPLGSFRSNIIKDAHNKRQQKASEKKEWQDATCSVCMEYPHNAVLLLCSSHHKGCRPYMCATSYRYSNCLDQYKKAYTKPNPAQIAQQWAGPTGLLCPLCRGEVKGWTVVERARKFLNSKKRNCMQENCLFVGSYRALRKHVRADHPWARPREVDPSVVEKWKKLENDSQLNDVMSTINSTMPGSIVMGDYVIDGNYLDGVVLRFFENHIEYDDDDDDDDDGDDDNDDDDDGDEDGGGGAALERVRNYINQARRRRGRVVLGGSRRRR